MHGKQHECARVSQATNTPQQEPHVMQDATPLDSEPTKGAAVFDQNARGFWTPGAAWYLGRAQVTLRKWRVLGGGPAFRMINGRAYYLRDDLDAWIAGHNRFRSTSEATVAGTAA
jgi:hypothetical protein